MEERIKPVGKWEKQNPGSFNGLVLLNCIQWKFLKYKVIENSG